MNAPESATDAALSAAEGAMPADEGAVASVVEDAAGPTAGGAVEDAPLAEAGASPLEVDTPVVDSNSGRFSVKLVNFEGPFDLLLQLIGKHKLDVTEVALHQVTDDFIAHIRAAGDDWDLDEASEFLVIAATLLDLKAARLLPAAAVEDEEDLALLEARDLLFARLLQYRAFKQAAAHLSELAELGQRRWPRAVALEERYAEALPDLVLGVGLDRFAKLAAKAFSPKPAPPTVSIAHIHDVKVSVREHAETLRDRLEALGIATFRVLVSDCQSTLEVVARFLALLELYRENLVGFEQIQPLGELTVRWIAADGARVELDFDEYAGSPAPPESAADAPSGDSGEPGDSAETAAADVAEDVDASADASDGADTADAADAEDGQPSA
ncbi:segregation and condensation protein A [Hamadaea flava]|uniref:Segregation and condensation protein A n=1 Tax=Hamadaea flava TaxID=1742688 RepID=A0ABV8LRT7_9ACTN|nr:segregation/condensation protein A [Hamadaea flava]MCP2328647.1 segregation and condensation protein A [Hamadaea flava]